MGLDVNKDALREADGLEDTKAQLRRQLEDPNTKGFNLNLDSASLGAAVESEATKAAAEEASVISDTTVDSEIAEHKVTDTLTVERADPPGDKMLQADPESFMPTITITKEEKDAFLNAITFDERFELPFSIFNGKVKGIIRNRSLQEHNVLVAFINGLVASKQITTDDEYQQQLRALTLAAQVKKLGDKEYPILAQPLAPQDGKAGWLEAYNYWLQKDGNGMGITRAVFREIQKFETKYWSMLQQSENENFWQTAESI